MQNIYSATTIQRGSRRYALKLPCRLCLLYTGLVACLADMDAQKLWSILHYYFNVIARFVGSLCSSTIHVQTMDALRGHSLYFLQSLSPVHTSVFYISFCSHPHQYLKCHPLSSPGGAHNWVQSALLRRQLLLHYGVKFSRKYFTTTVSRWVARILAALICKGFFG